MGGNKGHRGGEARKLGFSRLFFSYLKERGIWLALLASVILLFFAVAGLYGYDVSVRNMLYAVYVSVFFIFAACLADMTLYCIKCRKLEAALGASGECAYHLPVPKGLAEQLYDEMVRQAEQENRKLISELDEKKEDMADYYTMWIHQVKTPIAALRLLQQGMEGDCGAEGEEKRKQSAEELFKIEQYAEMALHYARLNSMSGDMLLKRYDVSVIIRHAVRKYSILFIGSGLSFSMEDFRCEAVTDEKWLGFVLEQLLANALKYTSAGGIHIYGMARNGKACSGTVEYIALEDTGIGIRAEDLPRIFERGFTGYNGRMDRKSTGIGLYLCRSIMDRLGHTLQVESAEGKGTRVILGFGQEEAV